MNSRKFLPIEFIDVRIRDADDVPDQSIFINAGRSRMNAATPTGVCE